MPLEKPSKGPVGGKGGDSSIDAEKQLELNRAEEIQAIHKDLEGLLDSLLEKTGDEAEQSGASRGQRFVAGLEEIFIKHQVPRDFFSYDRAWSQDQVDRAVDIINDYVLEDQNFLLIGNQLFLSHFFLTHQKNEGDGYKGKTISDLFIRSIINRVEGDKGVAIGFQSSISNWAQNIHMVDEDILLDFFVAMQDHPEKIDSGIRNGIIEGVGLFPFLIKPLKELADEKDVSSRLKLLSVLEVMVAVSVHAGFREAGIEARSLLEKIRDDQSNHFCSRRAEQVEERVSSAGTNQFKKVFFGYHEPLLASRSPQPLFLENHPEASPYIVDRVQSRSCYSRLSTETGVIYNGHGEVESFFDLNDGRRLTIDSILEREGFIKTQDNQKEYETRVKTYMTLIGFLFRNKIEEEFSIALANFSIREQLQFVNFISTKSVSEVKKAKEFILAGGADEAKNNRFKSFLALEAGSEIGEDIIGIGGSLADQPEVADRLFAKQADLVAQIDEQIGRFSRLYGEIFFEKSISRDDLAALALKKTARLIATAQENLSGAKGEDKEEIIDTLIKNLNEEAKNVNANLGALKSLALNLNEKYDAIGQDLIRAFELNYDAASLDAAIKKSSTFSKETLNLIEMESAKHKKYDSQRLQEIIEQCKQLEIFEEDILDSPYRQTIERLEQVLPLQIALEKKLDQLIYGREDARLPAGFGSFENDKIKPEDIPAQTPLYFPVGISKDLPAWEKVFRGEQKAIKPIDIYGYLFWLNNQDRPISFVVCDELQVSNYMKRFGKDEAAAREGAIQIGNHEALQYKKIIDTFGLENVSLQTYDEFLAVNKDRFERYQTVVQNLSIQPAFEEAFLAMVQDSVSGAEKGEYINYALEELAWIISADGTKIGHLNEARYDILAAVISNWEKVGAKKNIDVLEKPGSEEAQAILRFVCRGLRDVINEKKSKLERNSSTSAYYQRLQEHLKKIKPEKGGDKYFKKEPLDLNFVCPDVGSASFGWRGDFEGKESVVKFKEPYSTYFYKDSADLLIDSDQVVAAGEGYIGGKILTLESKKQQKYAESVVRPILKHYFKHLEKTPARYFEEIGKSVSELKQESEAIISLLDAIRFIQKYIIRPTELI